MHSSPTPTNPPSQEPLASQTDAPEQTDATEQTAQPKPSKPFTNRPFWADKFNKLVERQESGEDLSQINWTQVERNSEERRLQKAKAEAKTSKDASKAKAKDNPPTPVTADASKKRKPVIFLEETEEGSQQAKHEREQRRQAILRKSDPSKTKPQPSDSSKAQEPEEESRRQKYIERLQAEVIISNIRGSGFSKDQLDRYLSRPQVAIII